LKTIKLFEEFIAERFIEDEIPQLQIIMRGNIGLTSKTEDFTKDMMSTLYDKYIHLILVKGDSEYNRDSKIPRNRRHNKVNPNIPMLNFTSNPHSEMDGMVEDVYNRIEDIQISADKVKFYKAFEGVDFVPKTVYRIDDVEELNTPIIAKPSEGFSAQGIEKFDTYEEAVNSKMEFDVWQEAKEIAREFRAFIMDGKIIHIAERITNSKNDKSVGKKDADEKIDLVYIDQDMEKFPHLKRVEEIKKELGKKVKLEFYNIDLMLDKDGVMWVPEINGAPGIGPSMFPVIYEEWVKMAYGMKIGKEAKEELEAMAKEHRLKMKQTYPTEYKNSLAPISI
jgi:hypothetical protein